ncbi:MAG: PAS domain-containing protein [Alphaproteobacteria bacterium]|nr:PAS domain-containing protein [Alphaproteobacteria bacterium]
MSFQQFEQTVVSPALKHVARHWNAVRGSRAMPAWDDIVPSQIAAELTIVWSYRYDRMADAFTGRLAGDQIEKIFGKKFRGSPMSKLYRGDDFTQMFARFKRVVREPALYRSEGMVFRFADRYGHGERIALPLADGGVAGDGIFGATKYNSIGGTPGHGLPECESWFAV